MVKTKPKIALVTFTDDRDVGVSSKEVENYLRKKQEELQEYLLKNEIEVVDPLSILRKVNEDWYGLRKIDEVRKACEILKIQNVDGIIIGAWTWAPPMLIIELLRQINLPLMYYTENNPLNGGLSQFSATGASLMEWGVNEHALKHERNFGDRETIIKWARSMHAVKQMQESALLLWGGSYAVKMEHLQDDIPKLKTFLIRDIFTEDQYILINRAEKILNNDFSRISKFLNWVKENGLEIKFDSKMLTEKSFHKQIALLIAARDRLKDLKDENIRGVSIKCQPDIYFEYGVDACTLPVFLPFAFNEEGHQDIYPTVCEGDIKGLLTSLMLFSINQDVPPAFGDLISVEDDYIEFGNCGGHSIFWASNSLNPKEALSKTTAVANIHGVSGAAFSFFGIPAGEITAARLTRIKGKYYMQFGVGKALDAERCLKNKLGDSLGTHLGCVWGKNVIDLGVKAKNFVKVFGANHLHVTLGDISRELEYFCRELDIPFVRLDSDTDMEKFYYSVRD